MGSAWPTSCVTAWPASTGRTAEAAWPSLETALPAARPTRPCDEVVREGFARQQIEVRRLLDLRYRGFDSYADDSPAGTARHAMPKPTWPSTRSCTATSTRAGRWRSSRRGSRSVARAGLPARRRRVPPQPARPRRCGPRDLVRRPAASDAASSTATRSGRATRFAGPAIVCEPTSTTVIDPGWQGEVLSGGELLLTDRRGVRRQPLRATVATESDPVMLEVFNNHFAGIAEQMGITLRNTATSVNVKERLDFSCALFTPDGDLVVNAPHIPVHLGAMGETVRQRPRRQSRPFGRATSS